MHKLKNEGEQFLDKMLFRSLEYPQTVTIPPPPSTTCSSSSGHQISQFKSLNSRARRDEEVHTILSPSRQRSRKISELEVASLSASVVQTVPVFVGFNGGVERVDRLQ